MTHGKIILTAVSLALAICSPSARGADLPPRLPVKAPVNPFTAGYPATSGFYFGIGTMGGGGSVSVTVPGINSASLVTNQISANGIVGYAWNVTGTQKFVAIEQWLGINNFNGSAPGFSFSGPATFTTRFMFGAPLGDILALFPNLPLPQVPPFPALPGGQVASNVKPYIAFDSHIDDVTLDVLGAGSNRDWRWSPGLSVGALGQLSSGSVVDVAAYLKFPDRGICTGPGTMPGVACTTEKTQVGGLLALKW